MKSRDDIRARLGYWAIRTVAYIFQFFPIDVNLRTARWLGYVWWRLDARRRERTVQHLRIALADRLSEDEILALSRRASEHLVMWFVEFLCAFRMLDGWSWSRFIEPVDMQEAITELMRDGGAILLTGHYGNFELTAYVLAAIGFDVVAVMRPLDNRFLNDFVVRTRAMRGLRLLHKKSVAAEAEDILKQGGAIAMVADQDAGRKGVFVDFFGRKASTYKSIALLAIRCEVPILVGYARRLGDRFRYEGRVTRIIRPHEWRDRDDPVAWITQEYTSAIEAFVREVPEQYLWIHRRWKSRPRGERARSAPSASVRQRASPASSASPAKP